MKDGKYYKRNKIGKQCMKAFQLFKILLNNIGNLIVPIPLTEEVMRTQFYDKVDEYKTLECTEHSYRQDEFKETNKDFYKLFFDFETITSEENICLIYAGFITMTYSKNLLVLTAVLLIC